MDGSLPVVEAVSAVEGMLEVFWGDLLTSVGLWGTSVDRAITVRSAGWMPPLWPPS